MSEQGTLHRVVIIKSAATRLTFGDITYDVSFDSTRLRIAKDDENYVIVTQKSQHVAYKATILGGFALEEEEHGDSGYRKCFFIDWPDDFTIPEAVFSTTPSAIHREYAKGQWIELGIEPVSRYHLTYNDGVEATFERQENDGFTFSFSTGFHGSFWSESDGSTMVKFKGECFKEPCVDDFESQSKFIVSRSKYSGKLILFLQEDARVALH